MSTRPLRFTPSYARQAGAQLVATMVTTALYGVAAYMIANYFYRHSHSDSWWTKISIAILGILVTLEAIFANHQMYDAFITNHDDAAAQDIIPVSMPAKTACIFLSAFFAQIFYASRIWKLGGLFESWLRHAVYPILALAFLQLGGGMIQVVIMCITKRHTVMWKSVNLNIRSMYINGVATAACDVLITIALVMIFRSTEVNATRRTRSLVEKLVTYTINRGIITSVFALLSIFLYDFASGTLYYLIPFSSNTHVYIISVISMLTAREELRENMNRSFHISDLVMNTLKTQDTPVTDSSTDAHPSSGQVEPNGSHDARKASMDC